MHVLIPFAASNAPACRAALPGLALPNLQALLARLEPQPLQAGAQDSYTPPHERVQAQALGLDGADGACPWAALGARQAGLIAPEEGAGDWGLLSLCHWQVGPHEVRLHPVAAPDAQSAQALGQAMGDYLAADGLTLHPRTPGSWWLQGAALQDLRCASPDRVLGRASVQDFMPRGPGSRTLQRLQSEMQMLLYTHPVNEARSAQGQATLNGFWLSGTGWLPPASQMKAEAPLQVHEALRTAALQDDAPAWVAAWQALDQTLLARGLHELRSGAPLQLTLCGEQASQTWGSTAEQPAWTRWRRWTRRTPTVAQTLEVL